MHQTKTTGAGKRVRELPIFIAKEAYVLQEEWLAVGFELAKTQMPKDRTFLFPEGCFYGARYGASHYMRRPWLGARGRWHCWRDTMVS